MDENQTPPQDWIDALALSDADIAAGRTEAWSTIREELLARIAESEAAQVRRRA